MLLLVFSIVSFIVAKKARFIVRTISFCGMWLVLGAVSSAFMKLKGIDSSTVYVLLFGCRYVPVFVMGAIFCDRYNGKRIVKDRTLLIFYIISIIYELFLTQTIGYRIQGIISLLVSYIVTKSVLSNVLKSNIFVFYKINFNIYLTHNQFGRALHLM